MTAQQEKLVTDHLVLVEKVAARVAKRMPPWIEMADLISLGNVGLCEAAIRFDSELHASFSAWAMIRIRGAMIDGYRGRNYPRLMSQIPEEWMGVDLVNNEGRDSVRKLSTPPECLIDHSSVLDQLIHQEECVVVSIDAVRARRTLDKVEGKAFDLHVSGKSLREIGRRHGKSGAWSHHVVHRARNKMLAELGQKEAA